MPVELVQQKIKSENIQRGNRVALAIAFAPVQSGLGLFGGKCGRRLLLCGSVELRVLTAADGGKEQERGERQ